MADEDSNTDEFYRFIKRHGVWLVQHRLNGVWREWETSASSRTEAAQAVRDLREQHRLERLSAETKAAEAALSGPRKPGPEPNAIPSTCTIYTRWRGARDRARKFGLEFALSPSDVLALYNRSGGRCEVTGVPFSLEDVRGPWTPSLDRMRPELGYTTDNCRFVCLAANQAMGKWGEDALLRMAEGIMEKR